MRRVAQFGKAIDLEAGEVAQELVEVDQEIVRLRDRVQRLDVRSSVDGIVQGLSVTSANAVVEPGQVIMEIVPVDDGLLVEVRLSPEDIGYIHEGQTADILRWTATTPRASGRSSGPSGDCLLRPTWTRGASPIIMPRLSWRGPIWGIGPIGFGSSRV